MSFISPDCCCYCARHVANVINSITNLSDVSDCLLQLSFCNLAGFFISFISIKEVRGLNCAHLKMDYENHIDEQKFFEELLTAVKEMRDWQMQPQNIVSGGMASLELSLNLAFTV